MRRSWRHAFWPWSMRFTRTALNLIASGRARLENGRVVMNSVTAVPTLLIWPV